MGTALGTMPSTGGGRPPAGKFTTPGGYLEGRGREMNMSHQVENSSKCDDNTNNHTPLPNSSQLFVI